MRTLGAIGVVELHEPVDLQRLPQQFVDAGVWVRPFGRLVYLMPPFVINTDDLAVLTGAVTRIIGTL